MEIVSGRSLDHLLTAIGTGSPRYLSLVSGRKKRLSRVGQTSRVGLGIAPWISWTIWGHSNWGSALSSESFSCLEMIFIFYIEPSYKMQTIQNLGFFFLKKQTRKGFLDNRIMLKLKSSCQYQQPDRQTGTSNSFSFFFLS